MKRAKNKARPDGRSNYDASQYLKIPYSVLGHPNFQRLSGNAVKILFEICRHHNGFNNGKIGVSYQSLSKNLMIGRQAVSNGLDDLQLAGFIQCTSKGYFTGRRASEWEITFLDKDGIKATNIWGQKTLIKTQRRKSKKRSAGNILAETALMMKNEEL